MPSPGALSPSQIVLVQALQRVASTAFASKQTLHVLERPATSSLTNLLPMK